MAILTAEEFRIAAAPGLTGTAEDTKLEAFIARADALIASWLGLPPASVGGAPTLEQATYTETYDGPGGRVLRLGLWPVASVTSIHDDPEWAYGADTLVDADDYTLDGRAGVVYLKPDAEHGAWSSDARALRVVFVAGWSTVPDPIKHAAIRVVKKMWQGRTAQGLATQSKSGASANYRPEILLDTEERRLLAPYRLARALA